MNWHEGDEYGLQCNQCGHRVTTSARIQVPSSIPSPVTPTLPATLQVPDWMHIVHPQIQGDLCPKCAAIVGDFLMDRGYIPSNKETEAAALFKQLADLRGVINHLSSELQQQRSMVPAGVRPEHAAQANEIPRLQNQLTLLEVENRRLTEALAYAQSGLLGSIT